MKRHEIRFLFALTKSNVTTWPLSISRGSNFTRKKAVDVGAQVYCVDSQARGFFPPEISASPPYLRQDYKQNGFGEKHGRARVNRLSGRKMGERYGARKAEFGRAFQKERESAGVERSRISRGFGKQ